MLKNNIANLVITALFVSAAVLVVWGAYAKILWLVSAGVLCLCFAIFSEVFVKVMKRRGNK